MVSQPCLQATVGPSCGVYVALFAAVHQHPPPTKAVVPDPADVRGIEGGGGFGGLSFVNLVICLLFAEMGRRLHRLQAHATCQPSHCFVGPVSRRATAMSTILGRRGRLRRL